MNDDLKPRDHAEAVALFRHALIGALCSRGSLTHGELAAELRELRRGNRLDGLTIRAPTVHAATAPPRTRLGCTPTDGVASTR